MSYLSERVGKISSTAIGREDLVLRPRIGYMRVSFNHYWPYLHMLDLVVGVPGCGFDLRRSAVGSLR